MYDFVLYFPREYMEIDIPNVSEFTPQESKQLGG